MKVCAYAMAGESDLPFYCVYYMQSVYKKEIIELKEQMNALTINITQLLDSFQRQNPNPAAATNTQTSTSKCTSSISKPASNSYPSRRYSKVQHFAVWLKRMCKGYQQI